MSIKPVIHVGAHLDAGALRDPLTITLLEMNQVAATIRLNIEPAANVVRAECFEVGVDGGKPESPLAVALPDLSLRIGTPFLWSPDAQPLYALVVSVERGGRVEHYELQFGFDAGGRIVVTSELKAVACAPPKSNRALPSLFVVGDSTAFSNGRNQRGWGDELQRFVDAEKLNVLNRAKPGRSTRSYCNEVLWNRMTAELRSGDFVLIQFGHNDADHPDRGRHRGVLPGLGAETLDVTLPDGRVETVQTFGWYLSRMVEEVTSRGAHPVLLSPTPRNEWTGERLTRNQSGHGGWAAEVAAATGIPFVDLTAIASDCYDSLGRDAVAPLFCSTDDQVHASLLGARVIAACVAEGLRKLGPPFQRAFFPDAPAEVAGRSTHTHED